MIVSLPETAPALEFDGGYGARARIGFIVLSSERTIEREMGVLVPSDVSVHFTRVPLGEVTVEALKAMEPTIEEAAAMLVLGGEMDLIAYACTSGSALIGERRVMELIKAGAPDVIATTLLTGVRRALDELSMKRIAVMTAYSDTVNREYERYLADAGLEVVELVGLGLESDVAITTVTRDSIKRFALSVDHEGADGLFISCGGLRAVGVIDELEDAIQKPVVSSNQAMLWDVLRSCSVDDRIEGYGSLLRDH
jgi:maleate isomerase